MAEIINLTDEIDYGDILLDVSTQEKFRKFSRLLQQRPIEYSAFGMYTISNSLFAQVRNFLLFLNLETKLNFLHF